jgi:hypothetical protein
MADPVRRFREFLHEDPDLSRIGPYRIIRERSAKTFEAVDSEGIRRLLLRLPRAEEVDRFRALAALNRPSLVRVLEVGLDSAGAFAAMEFAEGRALPELLEEGRISRETLLKIVEDVAREVDQLRTEGIRPGSIRAAGVIVGGDGRARLVPSPDPPGDDTGVRELGRMVLELLDLRTLPPELERIFRRAGDGGYASAGEFADELARFRRGAPARVRRGKLLLAAAAGALGLILAWLLTRC